MPDQPALDKRGYYEAVPALPAYTRYFGQGAIYAMTPCTEAAARIVAARIRAVPPIPFDPKPPQAFLDSPDKEEEAL